MKRAIGKLCVSRPIAPEGVEAVGEPLGIVGLDEQATAGLLHDLDERAAPWLDDGHTARHRLEQGQPLRLIVGRRHGQHVEAGQKRQLPRAIDLAAIRKLSGQPRLLGTGGYSIEDCYGYP